MERGQDDPERYTIDERLAHHQVPGAAVAIIRAGEILTVRGYGTRLAGTEAPIGPDTVFSAGSISKIVNAALGLRLVAEGTLDLDTDVNDFLERRQVPALGLWTSAHDLARLVIALNDSANGNGNFLPQSLASEMMTRVPGSWHGLGPRLNGTGVTRVFHHGGANDSYRSWIEGHLHSGDGIVILTNGTDGHWIYSELRKSAEDAFG